MMDGMAVMAPAAPKAQHPAKHSLPASHEGSICPFATAAPPARVTEPQSTEIIPARFTSLVSKVGLAVAGWDHIARGPPLGA